MDFEKLKFRAKCTSLIRKFFYDKNYLELDLPCFSKTVIPESSIEVFRTQKTKLQKEQYYLLPSPELHVKKFLKEYQNSVFTLSHCFRAGESVGQIHNLEFTMLEYYTVNANYIDNISITESLFYFLVENLEKEILLDSEIANIFKKPFLQLNMEEAFCKYANFSLAENTTKKQLLDKVKKLRINETSELENYSYKDLYELVLVSVIEPNLCKDRVVILKDYPVVSNTLSKRKNMGGLEVTERWEAYVKGVEVANCYTELRDDKAVNEFFKNEIKLRNKNKMSRLKTVTNFDKVSATLPECSGVALGFERLLMILTNSSNIAAFYFDF